MDYLSDRYTRRCYVKIMLLILAACMKYRGTDNTNTFNNVCDINNPFYFHVAGLIVLLLIGIAILVCLITCFVCYVRKGK